MSEARNPQKDATAVEQTYLIEYTCHGCDNHPEPALRGSCYVFFPINWCPLYCLDMPKWEAEIL